MAAMPDELSCSRCGRTGSLDEGPDWAIDLAATLGSEKPVLACTGCFAVDPTGLMPVVSQSEEQGLGELLAHSESDLVDSAWKWVDTVVVHHDLVAGWPLMTAEYRIVLTRAWLEANREHPLVAPELTPGIERVAIQLAIDPAHAHNLWPAFLEQQLGEILGHPCLQGFEAKDWGIGTRARPVAPGQEVVLFVESRGLVGPISEEQAANLRQFALLMEQSDEGWLVAELG